MSGNLVVTAPLSVTRESLRPYLVGGLGLLHVGIDDAIALNPVDRNLLALNLGGGVIGMLERSHGRPLRPPPHAQHSRRSSATRWVGPVWLPVRLSYWRATVGVTVRY